MNKYTIKKSISVLLINLLLFSMNVYAEQANLITNPSFEGGLNNWQEVEPVSHSDHHRSGKSSAKLSRLGARISQKVEIKPYTNYALSAFVKGSGRIGVEIESGIQEQFARSNDSWSEVTITFNSNGSTSALVYGEYYLDLARVDDFSLTETNIASNLNQPEATQPGLAFSNECPNNGELMILTANDDGNNDGNIPPNTIDGDLDNRWSSKGIGRFIEFDLGQVAELENLQIKWFKGGNRVYIFAVQSSIDGKSWEDVLMNTSSQSLNGFETHNIENLFNPGARYVRIIGQGNSDNKWNAITEVKLTGCY